MELLLEIREKDVGTGAVESFALPYELRKAARAIIFNDANEIALMAVMKHNYHKLPGGGIELGEDLHSALKREALEEAGSHIEIGRELGMVIEYRNKWKRLQISYCFFAKKIGDLQELQLTEREIANGFQLIWLPLDEAIAQLEKDSPDCYEGRFIRLRDLTFLRKVAEIQS